MRPYRQAREDEAASDQHSHDALRTQPTATCIGVRKSMHGLQSTGNALPAPAVAFHAALWPLCIFAGSAVGETGARAAAARSEESLGLALRVPDSERFSSSSTALCSRWHHSQITLAGYAPRCR
jgi:hypothetical protein